MSEQSDAQGQITYNKNDKHPHRRKVQTARTNESSLKKPQRLGAVAARKHVTAFSIRESRKKSSIE